MTPQSSHSSTPLPIVLALHSKASFSLLRRIGWSMAFVRVPSTHYEERLRLRNHAFTQFLRSIPIGLFVAALDYSVVSLVFVQELSV